MAGRRKRLWTDEEKRSICVQTLARGVSVAQVARRHSMDANTWLRDPRYAPEASAASADPDTIRFLPVEIVDRPMHDNSGTAADSEPAAGTIEIGTAGGH